MVTKSWTILFLVLFGQHCVAQKALYVRPSLGFHSPLSSIQTNGYKPFVTLVNNKIWLTLLYEINVEYKFKPRWTFIVSYGNGNSGLSMGVLHTLPCVAGGSAPDPQGTSVYHAEGFNDRRLLFQFRYNLTSKEKNKAIQFSISSGLGIDFRSNENDSSTILLVGANQCGEEFNLDPIILAERKKIGLILPLQINAEWNGLMFSLFYHQGITTHFVKEIDYLTNTYRDESFFKVRGSSCGFKISYPIRIFKKKIS